MTRDEACRRFAKFYAEGLYSAAERRGLVREGAKLRLDVTRAAALFGLTSPTGELARTDARHVRDVLCFLRDHPPKGWGVTTLGLGDASQIFLQPDAQRPRAGDRPTTQRTAGV